MTLCVASQRVIPNVSVYFVINSVRKKILDTPWYVSYLPVALISSRTHLSHQTVKCGNFNTSFTLFYVVSKCNNLLWRCEVEGDKQL
jgi:hypothetical protein